MRNRSEIKPYSSPWNFRKYHPKVVLQQQNRCSKKKKTTRGRYSRGSIGGQGCWLQRDPTIMRASCCSLQTALHCRTQARQAGQLRAPRRRGRTDGRSSNARVAQMLTQISGPADPAACSSRSIRISALAAAAAARCIAHGAKARRPST